MSEQANIEQLWYTWAPRGMEQIRGFQVYAASLALMNVSGATFKAINPYLGYDLPAGTDRLAATIDKSPFCLAYIEVDGRRILLQKNFTGSDTGGRIGTYFIHLLDALPLNYTAREAIQLWKSPFWKIMAPDSTSTPDFKDPHRYELRQVSPLELVNGPLSEWDIKQDPVLTRYLPFVIEAYAGLQGQQKLYIAAEDHRVASLIWGLTRCLPLGMLRDLTFSTYEANPSEARTRIVGTCLPLPEVRLEEMNAARLLPADSYNEQNVTLNCYTDKHSSLPSYPLLAEYAQFVVSRLLGEDYQREELRRLLESAERQRVNTVGELLFVYKFFAAGDQPQNLTMEDFSNMLQSSSMVVEYLNLDGVQEAVINLAISKDQWWVNAAKPSIINLRKDRFTPSLSPVLDKFASKAARKVVEALLTRNQQALTVTYDILQTTAPTAENIHPWLVLLSSFSGNDPVKYCSLELQAHLLRVWSLGAREISLHQIAPWLVISWGELEYFLSLGLPEAWQVLAVKQLLSRSDLSPNQVQMIEQSSYQPLVLGALRQMYGSHDLQEQNAVMKFFGTVAKYNSFLKFEVLDLVLSFQNLDVSVLRSMLQTACLNDAEKVYIFKRDYRYLLAYRGSSGSLLTAVREMVKLYVNQLSAEQLLKSNTKTILTLLQQHGELSQELQEKIALWLNAGHLVGFTNKPESLPVSLNKDSLDMMARAALKLKAYENEQYRFQFFETLVASVLRAGQKRKRLKELLDGLKMLSIEQTATAMLVLLAQHLERNYASFPYQELLPYIEVALEYAIIPQFKTAQEGDQFLIDVFRALSKHIRPAFNAIDKIGKAHWPAKMMQVWLYVSTDQELNLRPKSIWDKGVGFFLKGKQNSAKMPALEKEKEQKNGAADVSKEKQPAEASSSQKQGSLQLQETEQPQKQRESAHEETIRPDLQDSLHNEVDYPESAPDQSEHNLKGTGAPFDEGSGSVATASSLERRNIEAINGRPICPPITKEWVRQVCRVKKFCIPELTELMQVASRKEKAKAIVFLEEMTKKLQVQDQDANQLFSQVHEELVDDAFLKDWLDSQEKKDWQRINGEVEKSAKKIAKSYYKVYKDWALKNAKATLTENEFRDIAVIFLRRYQALKGLGTGWDDFLKERREKTWPTITYFGQPWSEKNWGDA
jgi:hypothetical protein